MNAIQVTLCTCIGIYMYICTFIYNIYFFSKPISKWICVKWISALHAWNLPRHYPWKPRVQLHNCHFLNTEHLSNYKINTSKQRRAGTFTTRIMVMFEMITHTHTYTHAHILLHMFFGRGGNDRRSINILSWRVRIQFKTWNANNDSR